jgi:ferredoxin
MDRGGGMGGGHNRGMGRWRGGGPAMGTGPGWRLESGLVPAAPMTHVEALRPGPVESSRRVTAVVDEDRCTACGACGEACPEQAISVNGTATVDPARCTGCGACIASCLNEALALARSIPAVAGDVAG